MKKLMSFNFFICCGLLVFSGAGWAQQRAPLVQKEEPLQLSNLIQESESLAVLNESSIQTQVKDSKRIYAFHFGYANQSSGVSIQMENETYRYEAQAPVVGASFSYLPWSQKWSPGMEVSMDYFSVGGKNKNPTQLHMLFAEPSLFLQGQINSHFSSRLGLGWGVASAFQRGFQDENTSLATGYGFVSLGLSFHFSKWVRSDLDWSLGLDHRRSFASREEDLIGNLERTSLGLSLSL